MKSAKELLLEYLEAFPIPAKAAALFSPDGALEIPYLQSLNIPPGAVGPDAITGFIGTLIEMVPDWKFSNTIIFIEHENQVFAEYEVHVTTGHTNRPFDQHFFGRLVVENGKIKLLREALNVVKTAQALLKNGVDDIPRE